MIKYTLLIILLFFIRVISFGQCNYSIPATGNNSITANSGFICDNGGLSNYSNNANGYTIINPSNPSNMVNVSGTSSLENCCDKIWIYDGAGLGGNLLWTGTTGTIPSITSTSGPLTVRLTSDGSTVSSGFSLQINNVPPEVFIVPSLGSNSYTVCSGVLYDNGGLGNYSDNINGFTILNPSNPSNMIKVNGISSGDANDSIRIFNGAGLGGSLLWEGNPGIGTIPSITSTSGPLTVQFISNGSINGSGFALDINCLSPTLFKLPSSGSNSYTVCSGKLYDNGGLNNYSNNANGYSILYPSNPGNMIKVNGSSSLENCCDKIWIYDGAGLGGNLLWTGTTGSIPNITSTTGPLTVRLTSDGSTVSSGFVLNINCIPPEVFIVPESGSNSYTVCSGILYDNGGLGNYSDNINGYTILNPSNTGNMISVSGISSGDANDSIRIFNGAGLGGNLLWEGNPAIDTIPIITSTSGPLTVQFISNGSINGSGFALDINCLSPTLFKLPSSGSNSHTVCSGRLYDNGGLNNYSNNANGYSILYPSNPGNMIKVDGSSSLENCCDKIWIYDGAGLGGNLLWNGTTGTIPPITSTSGPLTVRLTSDGSTVSSGFILNINCIPPEVFIVPESGSNSYTVCSGILYDNGGLSNYSNNSDGYTILNPSNPGNMIKVSGISSGDASDWIKIFNGTGLGGNLLWEGSTTLGTIPSITSTSGPLTVQFTSDGSTNGSGFALDINCISPTLFKLPYSGSNSYTVCSGRLYDNGGLNNYSNNANGYTILYPSNPGSNIEVNGSSSLENCCDKIWIYDGAGLGGNLLWNGTTGSIPNITSTTGPLTVRLTSDGSSVSSGFILNINCIQSVCNSYVSRELSEWVCSGDSLLFGNNYLNTAGVYVDTIQNTHPNGCDTILTLNLAIQYPTNDTINQTIYTTQSYLFGGNTYSSAGTYTDYLNSTGGCDSIVTLVLNVISPCANSTPIACGQSISNTTIGKPSLWNNYSCTGWNESGPEDIYSFTLTHATTVRIGLSGMSVDLDAMVLSSCNNNCIKAIHNSENLALQPGNYYIVVDGYRGAQGSYTLTYERVSNPSVQINVNNGSSLVCKDELISFTASTSGTGSATVTYQWKKNGINVGSNSSSYSSVILQSDVITCDISVVDGCINTVSSSNTLNMSVKEYELISTTEQICQGEVYQFRGNYYNTTGVYRDTVLNTNTCHAIYELSLIVSPSVSPSISISASQTTLCSNEETLLNANIYGGGNNPVINWQSNGSTFYTGGSTLNTHNYVDGEVITAVLTSSLSCASPNLVTSNSLTFTILPVANTNLTASICQGEEYDFDGSKYTTSGIYQNIYTSLNGCDSIVTLSLTVNPTTETLNIGICTNGSYSFKGNTLTQAGTYYDTITSSTGCDSVVTLNLTVSDTIISHIDVSICEGDSYTFGPQNLTSSGTYTESFTSIAGCDSIVNLNLIAYPIARDTIYDTINQGEAYIFGGNTISTSGKYTNTLSSSHQCDSIITLYITVKPVINTSINYQMCQGESYDFGGKILSIGGNYTDSSVTANGYDSITTLSLFVNPNYLITISDSICQGSSYSFGGNMFTSSGTYYDSLSTINGCDSIIELNLIILDQQPSPTISIISSESDTICSSSVVTYTATVVNGGINPIYQWKKNAINIGTGTSTYSTNNLTATDIINCEVIGNNACAISNSASSNSITHFVKQSVTPTISITSDESDTICSGVLVNYTASITNGGNNPIYQWKKNGINVGTGTNNYSTNSLSSNDVITCVLMSSLECVSNSSITSNSISKTILSPLALGATISASDNIVCEGEEVNFTISLTGQGTTNISYQWKVNNVNVALATGSNYLAILQNNDVVTCQVNYTSNCGIGQTISNSISITVNPLPTVSISEDIFGDLEAEDNLVFGDAYYQWQLDGIDIPGAIGNWYNQPDEQGTYTVIVTSSSTGCSNFSDYTYGSVGILKANEKAILVYPNPTNGNITISSQYKIEKVKLIDMNGKIVQEFINKSNTSENIFIKINNDISNGIYWLEITQKKNLLRKKIVIKK